MSSGLDTPVLVLNRTYQPVQVTSARRAFTLLYLGAAQAIAPDFRTFDFASWSELAAAAGDDVVHTIGRAIKVPRVIVLQLYDRLPRGKVRLSRLNVYARDDDTCQYCGRRLPRPELNLDHVVPRAQGGRTTWQNVVCCCVECNLRKGARTPAQAGLGLLRPPRRPEWTPFARGRRVAHREWLPFLGLVEASYWNVELLDDPEA